MATRREYLTDEQWSLIPPLISPAPIRADGKGRPREHSDRDVMNGVMWVLRTGAAWMDLPDRFPSGATCFRRFSVWVKGSSSILVIDDVHLYLKKYNEQPQNEFRISFL